MLIIIEARIIIGKINDVIRLRIIVAKEGAGGGPYSIWMGFRTLFGFIFYFFLFRKIIIPIIKETTNMKGIAAMEVYERNFEMITVGVGVGGLGVGEGKIRLIIGVILSMGIPYKG